MISIRITNSKFCIGDQVVVTMSGTAELGGYITASLVNGDPIVRIDCIDPNDPIEIPLHVLEKNNSIRLLNDSCIQVKESSCYFCGKMNDYGIKTCWWCGNHP